MTVRSGEQRCTRCVLPATCANIDFDSEGVCNFCRAHDRYGRRLRDHESLTPLLRQRLDRVRGKHAYDCLIGLSGGKDSSYVAYRMTRHHGLRALLVTYDNGFLTDYARENIKTMVERLGQDHVFLSPPPAFHRSIYRSCMNKFGVPCIGCTFPGMLMCIKLAVEKDIPLLVHGRSPAQMFKELTDGTYDPFLQVMWGNLRPYDAEANKRVVIAVTRRMMRLLRSFLPDRALRRESKGVFHPDLAAVEASAHAPEFVGLFVYEPYDELRIMDEMERELGWRRPASASILTHEDCRVHHAAAYCYNQVCGLPIVCQELSTMVRRGEMARDDALQRLDRDHARVLSSYPADQAAILAAMAGMTDDELRRAIRKGRRNMNVFKALLRVRHAVLPRKRLPL